MFNRIAIAAAVAIALSVIVFAVSRMHEDVRMMSEKIERFQDKLASLEVQKNAILDDILNAKTIHNEKLLHLRKNNHLVYYAVLGNYKKFLSLSYASLVSWRKLCAGSTNASKYRYEVLVITNSDWEPFYLDLFSRIASADVPVHVFVPPMLWQNPNAAYFARFEGVNWPGLYDYLPLSLISQRCFLSFAISHLVLSRWGEGTASKRLCTSMPTPSLLAVSMASLIW